MEDDLPPPLEDMTEQLSLRTKLAGRPKTKPSTKATSSASSRPAMTSTQSSQADKARSNGADKFGGLSKGFLFGSSSKSNKQSRTKAKATTPTKSSTGATKAATTSSPASSEDDIPFIQAKPNAAPGHLPEVQEAMKQAAPFLEQNQDQWLTPDLLKRFQSKPHLLKCMNDPRFMQALKEFQTDPAAAKQKYGHNQEVTQFFKDYFEVMGEHFTQLADEDDKVKQQEQQAQQLAPDDQAKIDEIMKDPLVVEALKHPKVSELISTLKHSPEQAPVVTQQAMRDPVVARHVKSLYQAGLLGVAS
eukprot:TRINITY_DN5966_c0_g1_i1.p1 TRINITY_DN5966_c0_g1~~TRINITY_DN5966_c0_g1_i1.p1  ORF type:complete len:303 (+),score=65.40 TRINITY_DN5966_c0_g1_i1:208-1116(+)